jgi:hypothetical protein
LKISIAPKPPILGALIPVPPELGARGRINAALSPVCSKGNFERLGYGKIPLSPIVFRLYGLSAKRSLPRLSLPMRAVCRQATVDRAGPNDTDVVKDFTKGLFTLFGLVLNALIAIELLENLGGYLSRHILQVELVISTSLIAVARKIIILDLEKTTNLDILAFAATILALAVAYWVVRSVNPQAKGH